MQRETEREIREQLVKLRAEHRALDEEIAALQPIGGVDRIQITRLKKKKLLIKDRIEALQDRLLPDIIA
ncbi:MAG: YdcH family protein [Hyphomicrobiaceae bacterium]